MRKRINGQDILAIAFDWDGTLMDSVATIVSCVQATAHDSGLPVPTDAQVRYVVGLGIDGYLSHTMPQLPQSQYVEARKCYRQHALSHADDVVQFPGVLAMIDQLEAADYRLAIATGKTRRGLDLALNESGLVGRFHATRCAEETHTKPDPMMPYGLIAAFDIPPVAMLMIGNTTHDLQMGY